MNTIEHLLKTTFSHWHSDTDSLQHTMHPRPPDNCHRAIAGWLSLVAAALWCSVRLVATSLEPDDRVASSEKTLLDLSKRETFITLAVNADPQDVQITDVKVSDLPTTYRLMPASGIARLGTPLDIQLEKPENVRIRLAVVKRGKELALRVSPQIVFGRNDSIELTQDRITRSARKLHRQIKNLNQQLSALSRERQALDFWLASPGNKPLVAVESAHLRIKLLDQAIKTRRRDIPMAQSQCLALGQAAEFVKTLHKNVEIRYSVKVEAPDEKQAVK